MTDLADENLHKHNPADGSTQGTISELMHRIALGHTVAVLPQSLTTPLREDLVTVPVTDIPPSVLQLAWPAHSTSPSVAALRPSRRDSRHTVRDPTVTRDFPITDPLPGETAVVAAAEDRCESVSNVILLSAQRMTMLHGATGTRSIRLQGWSGLGSLGTRLNSGCSSRRPVARWCNFFETCTRWSGLCRPSVRGGRCATWQHICCTTTYAV